MPTAGLAQVSTAPRDRHGGPYDNDRYDADRYDAGRGYPDRGYGYRPPDEPDPPQWVVDLSK